MCQSTFGKQSQGCQMWLNFQSQVKLTPIFTLWTWGSLLCPGDLVIRKSVVPADLFISPHLSPMGSTAAAQSVALLKCGLQENALDPMLWLIPDDRHLSPTCCWLKISWWIFFFSGVQKFRLIKSAAASTLPIFQKSHLNELCFTPQPHLRRNYSAQWAAGRHHLVLFSGVTNSRDGAAQGGLAFLWRRWFLSLSISRAISALQGETSRFTEHLSSRAAVKSELGVTDCERAQKDTASNLAPDSPPRYEFVDYGDVVMPRRVNYRRFPRLNQPS